MEKPIIKFSHDYTKLFDSRGDVIRMATLLDVLPVRLEKLSKIFLDYDTDNGTFKLPVQGNYMMLLFRGVGYNDIFTTLRPYKPYKWKWYKNNIGKIFDIKINE